MVLAHEPGFQRDHNLVWLHEGHGNNLILKSKAYGAALQPELLDGSYNQDYKAQLISKNIAQLLKDGVYLKHEEKDAQVFSETLSNNHMTDTFYTRDEPTISLSWPSSSSVFVSTMTRKTQLVTSFLKTLFRNPLLHFALLV